MPVLRPWLLHHIDSAAVSSPIPSGWSATAPVVDAAVAVTMMLLHHTDSYGSSQYNLGVHCILVEADHMAKLALWGQSIRRSYPCIRHKASFVICSASIRVPVSARRLWPSDLWSALTYALLLQLGNIAAWHPAYAIWAVVKSHTRLALTVLTLLWVSIVSIHTHTHTLD